MVCGGPEKPASALDCYRKLLKLEPDRQPFDRVEKTLLVRRDRWVQSRLAELRETAGGEWTAKIDELARRCDAGLWPAFFSGAEKPGPQSKEGGATERNVEWPLGKMEVAITPARNQTAGHIRHGGNVGQSVALLSQPVDSISIAAIA